MSDKQSWGGQVGVALQNATLTMEAEPLKPFVAEPLKPVVAEPLKPVVAERLALAS